MKISCNRKSRVALIFALAWAVPLGVVSGVASGAYYALSPVALSDKLLYANCPRADYSNIDFAKLGLAGERVEIEVKGGKLYGFYFADKKRKNYTTPHVVLLNHGQGPIECHFGVVKAVLDAGADAFIYDYEGFGASANKPSCGGMLADAHIVYDYLLESRGVDAKNVIVMGTSLGTGVAAELARTRRCAGAILISPYTSISRVAHDTVAYSRLYPGWLFPQPDLSCEKLARQVCNLPIILIHGTKDQRISPQNSRDLKAMSGKSCSLVLCEESGHAVPLETIVKAVRDIINCQAHS